MYSWRDLELCTFTVIIFLCDFRFNSYGSNSGFHVFSDLDLDLWHMFYFLSHALGKIYWNLHAKFHKNPSSINGLYAADTSWRTHTHTNTQLIRESPPPPPPSHSLNPHYYQEPYNIMASLLLWYVIGTSMALYYYIYTYRCNRLRCPLARMSGL